MVLRESLECVLVVPGSKCAIVEILFLADVVDPPGQTLAPPHLALVDLVDLVDPPGQTLAPPHPACEDQEAMGAILGRGEVKKAEVEEEEEAEGTFGKSLFHRGAAPESQLNCLQALGLVRNMEVFLPALTTAVGVCYIAR